MRCQAKVLSNNKVSMKNKDLKKFFSYYVLNISQNPLAVDLILNLPNDGIRLKFDSSVQQLKVLVVKTNSCT
jgi:hypothetical protein